MLLRTVLSAFLPLSLEETPEGSPCGNAQQVGGTRFVTQDMGQGVGAPGQRWDVESTGKVEIAQGEWGMAKIWI